MSSMLQYEGSIGKDHEPLSIWHDKKSGTKFTIICLPAPCLLPDPPHAPKWEHDCEARSLLSMQIYMRKKQDSQGTFIFPSSCLPISGSKNSILSAGSIQLSRYWANKEKITRKGTCSDFPLLPIIGVIGKVSGRKGSSAECLDSPNESISLRVRRKGPKISVGQRIWGFERKIR